MDILQKGEVRPWGEAVLHVSSEAVTRGANVFEGLKGYWSHDCSSFGMVAQPRHFKRLMRSARLLHIPCPVNYETFENACHELVRRLITVEQDMWVRATLFAVEGPPREGNRAAYAGPGP